MVGDVLSVPGQVLVYNTLLILLWPMEIRK